jgi:uncharacterized membrane protein
MRIYIRILISLLILTWTAGVFAEFIIPLKSGAASLLPFLNIAYSNVCHQNSAKAIAFGVHHSLVCARCSGIYIGASLLSILVIFVNVSLGSALKRWMPTVIVLPMLADVIFYRAGLYEYSKNAAFFTGLLSGSAGFLYILDAFKNFINEYYRKKEL